MSDEKVYKFNEYCLCYDKGHNDRSCLQIIKVQGNLTNTKIYVMSGLYDESADAISMILDNLENEIDSLKDQVEYRQGKKFQNIHHSFEIKYCPKCGKKLTRKEV